MQCLHCYSRSGPTVQEGNTTNEVLRFLDFVTEQGYNNASFSGGEPFLYPDLPIVLAHAKSLGLSTNIVTNGTVANERLLSRIEGLTDKIAISLDGPAPLHNTLRDSSTAYNALMKNLPLFQSTDIEIGLIHTVTAQSIVHIEWLANVCLEQGFSFLQLHPLGMVGNAKSTQCKYLDGELLFRAYLAYGWIKSKVGNALNVHMDIFNAEAVKKDPVAWNVIPRIACTENRLSDLLNPLVLRADGQLVPICYDMHKAFSLGNIRHAENLSQLAKVYQSERYPLFVEHCSNLWESTFQNLEWPYFNWYEILETSTPLISSHNGD